MNDFEDAMLRDSRKVSSWIVEDSYSDYMLKAVIKFGLVLPDDTIIQPSPSLSTFHYDGHSLELIIKLCSL